MLLYCTVVATLGTAMCSESPWPNPTEHLMAADYGAEMTQAECEQATRDALETVLYDPFSAQYRFGECVRWAEMLLKGEAEPGMTYGYAVRFEVNAKNLMGAYTGYSAHLATMRDGEVLGLMDRWVVAERGYSPWAGGQTSPRR